MSEWGTSDTPAPTHPRRVVRNPLKEGGEGDAEERSRTNKKGGSCCIHITTDTWEQKMCMMRRKEIKSEKGKV